MQPRLSVGLIAGELRGRAERSLEHLLRQTVLDELEILVIDINPDKASFKGTSTPGCGIATDPISVTTATRKRR